MRWPGRQLDSDPIKCSLWMNTQNMNSLLQLCSKDNKIGFTNNFYHSYLTNKGEMLVFSYFPKGWMGW